MRNHSDSHAKIAYLYQRLVDANGPEDMAKMNRLVYFVHFGTAEPTEAQLKDFDLAEATVALVARINASAERRKETEASKEACARAWERFKNECLGGNQTAFGA